MENNVMMVAKKCRICGKPSQEAHKPFCSPHCAALDLGQWLGEGYRIPAAPDDPENAIVSDADSEDERG